ncbi:hypothetical protein C8R46DRAFT_1341642 [Mycena filopes]|nr:hypothetical protein C8R46DRAFT_1341642 [Mycena filopes]
MLDHYYTPRDLPPLASSDGDPGVVAAPTVDPFPGTKLGLGLGVDRVDRDRDRKAQPRDTILHDLRVLDDFTLEFDCDSGSEDESGSDDGYVSTLLRLQRQRAAAQGQELGLGTPRKIAGARRVARAVSSPRALTTAPLPAADAGKSKNKSKTKSEGEVFQSITATPGLESTSFEELRLETYLQSLVATGTARPQPAFCPAVVIPPAFAAWFCESGDHSDADGEGRASRSGRAGSDSRSRSRSGAHGDGDGGDGEGEDGGEDGGDVEMGDASPQAQLQPQPHPPFVFRAASYPPANAADWGGFRFGSGSGSG